MPTTITINRINAKPVKVRGQLYKTNRQSLNFYSERCPEWTLQLEGGMLGTGAPSAATYVLSDAEAQERADAGFDAGWWGGYHAQVVRLAEGVA